jgi:hypothetical protein
LRVHQFLINQIYQNFKIFLVGDNYDNQEEFDKIVSLFSKEKNIVITVILLLELGISKRSG